MVGRHFESPNLTRHFERPRCPEVISTLAIRGTPPLSVSITASGTEEGLNMCRTVFRPTSVPLRGRRARDDWFFKLP
jgi:hypothetical protein